MQRPFNFAAGPAALPEAVLRQAADEMLDYRGTGESVMEISHRGPVFEEILFQAESNIRSLLAIPDNYRILFTAASPTALNALIPMNLLGRKPQQPLIDFVYTGVWSGRSLAEAGKYARTHVAASSESSLFTFAPPPDTWQCSEDAAYLHICSNETINGVAFHSIPDTGDVPLVADMTSDMLSRRIDVSRYGVIFAGAQKNMGIAGVSLVIVRNDLLDFSLDICPSVYSFRKQVDADSRYNTPPTFAIYMAGLVIEWIMSMGGMAAMETACLKRSTLLYDCIDASSLYFNRVEKGSRSLVNVPFFLHDETLLEPFLEAANANGLINLRGHRLLGGLRASLYNAMPVEGVTRLVEFMREFERTH